MESEINKNRSISKSFEDCVLKKELVKIKFLMQNEMQEKNLRDSVFEDCIPESADRVYPKAAMALGNSYTATSVYWQYKYLSALSEQQLLYSKCILKQLKSIRRHQQQSSSGFSLLKSSAPVESESSDSELENSRVVTSYTIQEPMTPIDDLQNHLEHVMMNHASNLEAVVNNDTPSAPASQSTPQQNPQNPNLTNFNTNTVNSERVQPIQFPVGMYIKLLVLLIFTKASRVLLYTYTIIATCHVLGLFNTFILRIRQYFDELGFNHTVPLAAVIRQLRARQQFEIQQAQSELIANQILQDLQQSSNRPPPSGAQLNTSVLGIQTQQQDIPPESVAQGVILNTNAEIDASLLGEDDVLIQEESTVFSEAKEDSENKDTYFSDLISKSRPVVECTQRPRCNTRPRLYWMRFFYQLFIAFFGSLNPRWEPIRVLVLDDSETSS